MNSMKFFADKLAIGLSLTCAIHCLALPFLLIVLPNFAALNLDNEAFHVWMVVAVIPTSIYALFMGCKQHKRYELLKYGLIGLTLLILAVTLGEEVIGELWEKLLTVAGAMFVAYGHYRNFQLCQNQEDCKCDSKEHDESHV